MVWRACAFVFLLPLGLAVGLASTGPTSAPEAVAALGVLGGALGVLATTFYPPFRAHPSRGAFVLSSGLAAVPVALFAWLGVGSSPWIVLGFWLVGAVGFAALQTRRVGSVGGGRIAAAGVAMLVAGLLLCVLLGWLRAAPGDAPPINEDRRRVILDLDASVVTERRPDCAQRIAEGRVLATKGAHPRIGPNDHFVWLDAEADSGRRQIHRIELSTGELRCFSCGRPGNNLRPVPSPDGGSVVFETDRHATWRTPADTEIYLAAVREPIQASAERRISRSPGTDDFPVFGPTERAVIWSRSIGGRHDIVSASLGSGHGGFVVGIPAVVYRSGSAFVAPVAWSPDARRLLIARGTSGGSSELVELDPSDGQARSLGRAPLDATAGFSRDGGWIAWPSLPDPPLALLDAMGFVVGPAMAAHWLDATPAAGALVVTGPSEGEGVALPADALLDWGATTGVDVTSDARRLVVAQERDEKGRHEERLVELRLACDRGARP